MNRYVSILVGALSPILLTAHATGSPLPLDPTGLVLHVTGANGAEEQFGDPAENSDGVVRWLDQGPVGNHASTNNSYVAGPTTPTYVANAVNSQAMLTFDSNTDRLQLTNSLISGSTDYTIMAVIRGSGAGERVIGSTWGFSPALNGMEFYVNNRLLTLYTYPPLNFSGATTLTDNTWYIVEAERSGVNYTLRVNNAVDGTSTVPINNAGNMYNWTIGNNGGYNTTLAGDMAEQIVYTKALNAAERNITQNHLSSLYNIAIANDRYAGDTAGNQNYDLDVFGIGRETTGVVSNSPFITGLKLSALNNTLDATEYLLAGNKVAANSLTTSDLPSDGRAISRWSRVWYLDETGALDAELTFDFSEGGVPLTNSAYRLYYSATDPFAFADTGINGIIAGDQVSFDVLGASLQDGYYTLVAIIPEPSTTLLLVTGGLWILRKRRRVNDRMILVCD